MVRDYYQVLGVGITASPDEIKKTYRRLAKQYHPDVAGGSRRAEELFKEIAQAYQVLSNGEQRREYDLSLRMMRSRMRPQGFTRPGPRGGREWQSSWEAEKPPKKEPSPGPEPPLHEKGAPRPGRDISQELRIPLELAARGGSTRLWIDQEVDCGACGGSGAKPGTKVRRCLACKGTGLAPGIAGDREAVSCSRCHGRGVMIRALCGQCGGSGHTERKWMVSVPVPRGVRHGDEMRLAGRGQPGRFGGPPGDLYLKIRIEPHREFRRMGYHIESTAMIDIFTATLGGKIIVPTLNGNVWVVVPPGTRSGTRLRLKGGGLPQPGGENGDHHVVVAIEPPKELNDEQRALMRKMAQALHSSKSEK